MPPLVREPQGNVKSVGDEAAGLPLGVMDGIVYEQSRSTLCPGEIFFLYTDGVTDACNADDQFYTTARLMRIIAQPAESLPAFAESVIADIRAHVGSCPQTDDMCLVAFAYAPST
jgi:phosphoserine phosphatase RsbU/P